MTQVEATRDPTGSGGAAVTGPATGREALDDVTVLGEDSEDDSTRLEFNWHSNAAKPGGAGPDA